MADVFSALAGPTRRSLPDRLREEGRLSVGELTEPLEMSRQAVTRHLDVLEDAGLVERERRGRRRLHRLVPEGLREVDDSLTPYADAWDRRLEGLQKHLAPPNGGDDDDGDARGADDRA